MTLPFGTLANCCPNPSSHCVDTTLGLISVSSTIFGIASIALVDTLTGVGYIGAGVFAGVSLVTVRKMRLRASVQKSVNVMAQENDELKENNDTLQESNEVLQESNEELKENVDTLEQQVTNLRDIEVNMKKLLGLVGEKSDDAIKEVTDILNRLNTENERHSLLVKKQILLHIYSDPDNTLPFKDILLQMFPNLEWDEILRRVDSKELD